MPDFLFILLAIFATLVALFILITIHEFGHYSTARLFNIKVLKFSIGFGKPIFTYIDKKGTEIVLGRYLIGGYVKMLDEREGTVKKSEQNLAFNRQKIWKRFCVVLAGPFLNIVLALVLFWLMFVIGYLAISPEIGEITPKSIAAKAGLKSGVIIEKIDDHKTDDWIAISFRLVSRMGDKGTLSITTKDIKTNKSKTSTLNLKSWHIDPLVPQPVMSLGIIPSHMKEDITYFERRYSPIAAIGATISETIMFVRFNFMVISKLITGDISIRSLGGPLAIFQGTLGILEKGLAPFLGFLGLISVTVGIFNILPIPGLDGGHLVYLIIEKITKKMVSIRVQILAYRLGWICLGLLFVQIMLNDLLRFGLLN